VRTEADFVVLVAIECFGFDFAGLGWVDFVEKMVAAAIEFAVLAVPAAMGYFGLDFVVPEQADFVDLATGSVVLEVIVPAGMDLHPTDLKFEPAVPVVDLGNIDLVMYFGAGFEVAALCFEVVVT
jgi:hypothetical protein